MEKLDKIYLLLEKLGMNDEEIQLVSKTNTYLSKVLVEDVSMRIDYLKGVGLSKEEIRDIAISNPWILVEVFERIRMLEDIYKAIGIQSDKLKQLLMKYPRAMSLNPKMVTVVIEDLEDKGYSIEQIKQEILNNSKNYFGE